jgi:hypothetical protein
VFFFRSFCPNHRRSRRLFRGVRHSIDQSIDPIDRIKSLLSSQFVDSSIGCVTMTLSELVLCPLREAELLLESFDPSIRSLDRHSPNKDRGGAPQESPISHSVRSCHMVTSQTIICASQPFFLQMLIGIVVHHYSRLGTTAGHHARTPDAPARHAGVLVVPCSGGGSGSERHGDQVCRRQAIDRRVRASVRTIDGWPPVHLSLSSLAPPSLPIHEQRIRRGTSVLFLVVIVIVVVVVDAAATAVGGALDGCRG